MRWLVGNQPVKIIQAIKSNGGPLICAEREGAKFWLGTSGNSQANEAIQGARTDYERACDVADYVGEIKYSNRVALIFGDMPLETMAWQPIGQPPCILRIYYMDPDANPVDILDGCGTIDLFQPSESMNFSVECGDLIIFDSATPGSLVGDDFVSFEIPPGRYQIHTKRIEPNDRTSMLVHQFIEIKSNAY